jgi:hypothetical protein
MAHKTCPQCQTTVVTGFWEVFDNCPNCGMVWSTDPELKAQMIGKLALVSIACGVLSTVPVAGFFFGMAAVALGAVTLTKGRKTAGLTAIIMGAVLGLIGQPLLTYWGLGRLPEKSCESAMNTLAGSMYAYRGITHQYPTKLSNLSDVRLPAPEACPGGDGGKFFYISPDDLAAAAAAPTSGPTTQDTQASQPTTGAAKAEVIQATSTTAPATTKATYVTSRPRDKGNSRTLIAAEVYAGHRNRRTCMTSDLKALSIPFAQFDEMITRPENRVFAVKLDEAYRAATQPADETKLRLWSLDRSLDVWGASTQPSDTSGQRRWSLERSLEFWRVATQPTTQPAE